ncbi:MAG: hypothetical protein WAX66_00930 [Patescibacteria group bacterium]
MTNSLETLDAPEPMEEILNNSFKEIEQDTEKEYPDAIIIGNGDTVQKSIKDQMDSFMEEFPETLGKKDLTELNTLINGTRQGLTNRMTEKAQAISRVEGTNISINGEGFQRYRDIDSLLERMLNITSGNTKAS